MLCFIFGEEKKIGRLGWGLGMVEIGLFPLIQGFSLITVLKSHHTLCLLLYDIDSIAD